MPTSARFPYARQSGPHSRDTAARPNFAQLPAPGGNPVLVECGTPIRHRPIGKNSSFSNPSLSHLHSFLENCEKTEHLAISRCWNQAIKPTKSTLLSFEPVFQTLEINFLSDFPWSLTTDSHNPPSPHIWSLPTNHHHTESPDQKHLHVTLPSARPAAC